MLSNTINKIFWIIPVILGISGELFVYNRFNQPFGSLNWFDCVIFYCCGFAIIIGLTSCLFIFFKPQNETKFKVILITISVFFVLLVTEVYLRITDTNKAYIENRGGKYISAYVKHDNNVNRIYGYGTVSYLEAPEFKYVRHHNNLGFSDIDFLAKKDSNTILIQTYGDSFTEGDGAPSDSSYPAILRDILKHDGQRHIIVQNFGICGNDPAFYWKQFKDIGVKLKPDIAVIAFDSGDMTTDFLTKGGLERFKDGYYEGYNGPSWEWLYGASYVFRLFAVSLFNVQYNLFFLSQDQRAQRLKELEPKWNQTFKAIAEIARKNNVKILLIKRPNHWEVDSNKYSYEYSFFDKMVDADSSFRRFDLLPFFRDSAHITSNNSINYWWPENAHNNGKGYAIIARGAYVGLRQEYPEIFRNSEPTH